MTLDDERQKSCQNDQNEQDARGGNQCQSPVIGKCDNDGGDDGAVELEEDSKLFGDTNLKSVRSGRAMEIKLAWLFLFQVQHPETQRTGAH